MSGFRPDTDQQIMNSETPHQDEKTGRVLRFETRGGLLRLRKVPPRAAPPGLSPVEDVGKYASAGDDRDDYRHRMKMNAAALVVLGLLVGCGIWLFDTLAELRKNQDCILSGRRNCAPINVPVNNR